eukprot:Clim_evm16s34 gene=Clim_evmTU16s34
MPAPKKEKTLATAAVDSANHEMEEEKLAKQRQEQFSKEIQKEALGNHLFLSRTTATVTEGDDGIDIPKHLTQMDGKDIVKKSSNKKRFLFAFPGKFEPIGGESIGKLAKMNTPNPEMTIELFGKQRLRFSGTLVHLKRNLITTVPSGNTGMLIDGIFRDVVVFTRCVYLGTAEENPLDEPMSLPKDLIDESDGTVTRAMNIGAEEGDQFREKHDFVEWDFSETLGKALGGTKRPEREDEAEGYRPASTTGPPPAKRAALFSSVIPESKAPGKTAGVASISESQKKWSPSVRKSPSKAQAATTAGGAATGASAAAAAASRKLFSGGGGGLFGSGGVAKTGETAAPVSLLAFASPSKAAPAPAAAAVGGESKKRPMLLDLEDSDDGE